MKLLLFLFGIYLLALGCLPCADSDGTGQGTTVVVVVNTHSHDCKGEETCPPFCTCSCCSIHAAPAPIEAIPVLPLQQPVNSRKRLSLQESLLTGAGNSIWQPPRLG